MLKRKAEKSSVSEKGWFKPVPYINWKVYVLFVLAVFSLSVYVRCAQHHYWEQHKNIYFAEGYPAMTTLDAYFWLRYAKEYKQGIYKAGSTDRLVKYPTRGKYPDSIPMLSFVIAEVSAISGLSVFKAGLFIVPLFASLFIIPLSIYYYTSNMPMAGVMGGITGSLGWMYMIRTGMGRVDTDLLQLFFLFLTSLFLLFVLDEEDTRRIWVYSALAGLTLALFGWWYSHNGIILVYLFLLLVILLIKRSSVKTVVVSLLVMSVCANPFYTYSGFFEVLNFVERYFSLHPVSQFGFPNVLLTITEAEHMPISKAMRYILSSEVVDVGGLLLFLASLWYMRARIIPLLPILVLGLMFLKGSNRTIMFLSPFVGVGIGFALDLLFSYVHIKGFLKRWKLPVYTVISALVAIGLIRGSAFSFELAPAIPPDIVKSIVHLGKMAKRGAVVSWWDNGYAIEDLAGLATYQDGGIHGGALTYLIARAFCINSQVKLYHIVSYLSRYGVKDIYKAIKKGEPSHLVIGNVLTYRGKIKGNNYLLFTRDMLPKFLAIGYIGGWDLEKEKPGEPYRFAITGCRGVARGMLMCGNNLFDLRRGLVDNRLPLRRFVVSIDGYMSEKRNYFSTGPTLELLVVHHRLWCAVICNERMFETNFNQMYLLGNYDKQHFEEVYDDFPTARVFRIK